MNIKVTQETAAKAVVSLYGRLRQRRMAWRHVCELRPPKELEWIDNLVRCVTSQCKIPKSLIELSSYGFVESDLSRTPLHVLLRTFKALRKYEAWLDKADAGMARHNEDLARQLHHAAVEIETWSAFHNRNGGPR